MVGGNSPLALSEAVKRIWGQGTHPNEATQGRRAFEGLMNHGYSRKNAGDQYNHLLTSHSSVSALLAVDPGRAAEQFRAQIVAALKTIQKYENCGLQTRKQVGGEQVICKADPLWAGVLHFANRNGEPCLHFNWINSRYGNPVGTNEVRSLVTTKPYYDRQSPVDSDHQINIVEEYRKLGYEMRLDEHGKAVSNVPKQIYDGLCTRRQQALQHLAAQGRLDTPAAVEIAVLQTRLDRRLWEPADRLEVWSEKVQTLMPGFDKKMIYQPLTRDEVLKRAEERLAELQAHRPAVLVMTKQEQKQSQAYSLRLSQ